MTCSLTMRRILSRRCLPTWSSVSWPRPTLATRRMINELLKYPEDSRRRRDDYRADGAAPGHDRVRSHGTIRKNGVDKETINNCYVTDRDRTLIGVVSLRH